MTTDNSNFKTIISIPKYKSLTQDSKGGGAKTIADDELRCMDDQK